MSIPRRPGALVIGALALLAPLGAPAQAQSRVVSTLVHQGPRHVGAVQRTTLIRFACREPGAGVRLRNRGRARATGLSCG